MCGITGCWDPEATPREALAGRVRTMADTLLHRGPDTDGVWVDERAGVGLGFRRLAILDLTPQGHQPMASGDGRYVIVFNGEIYNYLALRTSLEEEGHAPAWRGHSDTEVMLAAFSAWGVERTLERLVGMFALALWDSRERILHLARDRLGEKPLYYGWAGDAFVFGSELKALRAHPGFRAEVDREALALYLRYAYVPTPWSIYRDARKLAPAAHLALSSDAVSRRTDPPPRTYWSVEHTARAGLAEPFEGSDEEATKALDALLRDAVAGQMIADVPLGAFLSGGIDSSTVVALMQAQASGPVKTFTIGFHEDGYDEAGHARAIARHLGTEHTELYVTAREAMDVVPLLPRLYDEPFADSSQIPTYLVSRLARRSVTVSLSGDGGDELFGGYNRYFWATSLWRRVGWMPAGGRALLAGAITLLSPAAWDGVFRAFGPVLPAKVRQPAAGDKVHKLARMIGTADREALYENLVALWREPGVVRGALEPICDTAARFGTLDAPEVAQRMMYLDAVSYLPDDILVKVDRAAMGVSLETRVPLLDHRVVEFAWRLPFAMKVREGRGKWLLRRVLSQYVPGELFERHKMGFGIPLEHWLRGPLRGWAEQLLDAGRLERDGWFDPAPVRRLWEQHLSGAWNWQHALWAVLMFQAWVDAGGAGNA
jgi:asparagine synthase (glutamine-hydrolysing)